MYTVDIFLGCNPEIEKKKNLIQTIINFIHKLYYDLEVSHFTMQYHNTKICWFKNSPQIIIKFPCKLHHPEHLLIVC